MQIEELLAADQRIQEQIGRRYVDPSGKAELIRDGLYNPREYLSSFPRVLWILKEPYCDGNTPTGGGWLLTDDNTTDRFSRQRSFQPICYINHGIWKKIYDWDEMPWLRDSEEIRLGLKKIAFINISKLPGCKTSPWDRIKDAYQKNRDIILAQIDAYDPNLIFACDPHANLLLNDFGFSQKEWQWFDPKESKPSAAAVQLSRTRRLIWVDHPASRKKRKKYVNDAICAATASLTVAKLAE